MEPKNKKIKLTKKRINKEDTRSESKLLVLEWCLFFK